MYFLLRFRLRFEPNLPINISGKTRIRLDPLQIKEVEQIPFLPVAFFKTHRIIGEDLEAAAS